MDNLGGVLEVSAFTTGFVTDDYPTRRIILKGIYTVFKFISIHVFAKRHRMNPHIGISRVEQFQKLNKCSVVRCKYDQFAGFIVQDICLLVNVVHGSH